MENKVKNNDFSDIIFEEVGRLYNKDYKIFLMKNARNEFQ